jgi:hypothetical protein
MAPRDLRDCIPETQPKPHTQGHPSNLPVIGHKVIQLGTNYFNAIIRDLDAIWVRVETDIAMEIKVNGVTICDGFLQPSTTGSPPDRLFFPDSTVFPKFYQAPLSFEYAGAVNTLEFNLKEETDVAAGVDLRALVHVYYSTEKNVRVIPGRPHHYVYELTKLAGWGPIVREPLVGLCLNSFQAPSGAQSMFPAEIEILGMGVENPIAFAGFDVTRQSLIWRDASDLTTIREFARVCQNVGGATNQSFHHEFGVPVRIPYIACAQSVVGAPLVPQLQMELRHNGGGGFPEDLIVYINYRVV